MCIRDRSDNAGIRRSDTDPSWRRHPNDFALRNHGYTRRTSMREPTTSYLDSRATYVPAEFQHDFDVAECALDEQLEHLQRQYASAIHAASRARFELEMLELEPGA